MCAYQLHRARQAGLGGDQFDYFFCIYHTRWSSVHCLQEKNQRVRLHHHMAYGKMNQWNWLALRMVPMHCHYIYESGFRVPREVWWKMAAAAPWSAHCEPEMPAICQHNGLLFWLVQKFCGYVTQSSFKPCPLDQRQNWARAVLPTPVNFLFKCKGRSIQHTATMLWSGTAADCLLTPTLPVLRPEYPWANNTAVFWVGEATNGLLGSLSAAFLLPSPIRYG